jgi:hypothetical protein
MNWGFPVLVVSTLLLGVGAIFSETAPLASRDGLTIATKGDASFEDAVRDLTFEAPADRELLPFGAVIKSSGSLNVIAYSLQWVFDDGASEPVYKAITYTQPFALDDGTRPGLGRFDGDIVLAPGSFRLLTPSTNYALRESMNKPVPSSGRIGETRLAEYLSGVNKKPFKMVRLGGYVLQDGTCVQLTVSDLCSTVQAQVDANQDVFEEATTRVYEKDASKFVEDIRSSLAHRQKDRLSDDTYRFQYETSEATALGVIRAQLQNGNYHKMISDVTKRMYRSRPVIKERQNT